MKVTELYTVEELAKIAHVNTETIYRLIRSGELKAVKVGHSLRIKSEDFNDYLERE